MKFIVIGVNHKLMDIDERKSYSFRDSDKLSFSAYLEDEVDQILILSTCNRSEVYVVADDSFDENRLKTAYFSYFDQKDDRYVFYTNKEALLYLLEVACGLQSMVVGEDQILHQIKEALTWSMSQHFSGKEMNHIFQTVIKFAKEMKNKYAISEHPLSLSYIGYQHLRKMLKPDDKVMICGIGEMAQLMIEYLKDHELYIVNRTYEKVIPFLNEKRHYVPFDERYDYLEKVNAVVSVTSAPHSIFEVGKVNENQSLVFLDLAIPRDVDKQLKNENIDVIDMDILKSVSDHHLKMRRQICQSIQKECQEYVNVIDNELKMMKSDTLIQKMQKKYMDISDETYELLIHKLDLSSKEQYILKKVLKTSFLRLMKEPIQFLKNPELDQEKYIELVSELLALKENEK